MLTGGGPVRVPVELPERPFVVAADAGARLAPSLGLAVDVLVGDLDSLDPSDVEDLAAAGTAVERHPADKDATDLELALDRAVAAGASHVTVVGGDGGRLDHLLGVALAVASPVYAAVTVEAVLGPARVHVVRSGGHLRLEGEPGELVTLLPVHGPVRGVRTEGLRWRLDAEDLHPGSTRGLSNELLRRVATVAVGLGTLLVVRPGPDVPAIPDPEDP